MSGANPKENEQITPLAETDLLTTQMAMMREAINHILGEPAEKTIEWIFAPPGNHPSAPTQEDRYPVRPQLPRHMMVVETIVNGVLKNIADRKADQEELDLFLLNPHPRRTKWPYMPKLEIEKGYLHASVSEFELVLGLGHYHKLPPQYRDKALKNHA